MAMGCGIVKGLIGVSVIRVSQDVIKNADIVEFLIMRHV